MKLKEMLTSARQRVAFNVWKARTVGRVAMKTGMPSTLQWSGARVLLRDLPRGRSNPSLIFRFFAENNPHDIALIDPQSLISKGSATSEGADDRVYSYAELNERIDRVGCALSKRGFGAGKKALLVMKNRPEFLMIQAAIGRLGGASVTVSWRSTVPELEYLAVHSGAFVLFFDSDIAKVIQEAKGMSIPRDRMFVVGERIDGFPHAEDLFDEHGVVQDDSTSSSVVMYTSGTTGKPKGAVRTFNKDVIASTFAFIGETPMQVGEVHLVVCPLYHATAFGFISISLILGSRIVLLSEFRPELFLKAIQRYKVTTTALVPTMLHRLLELGEDQIRAYDTSSLKAIFSGGAPLPFPLARDTMNVLGDKLYNFYGATETGIVTLAGPNDLRASPGTIGRPIPGQEIRLVRTDGKECDVDEVGELYARSSWLIDGYHNDPEATSKSMLEGYFSVGDLARRDRRGCYHIEGRKRDMIISGGVNVYPAEVEDVLYAHEAIGEAAVVGVPDREWGERVRAFVVVKPGANVGEDDLKAYCRARLSGPKVPRDFVFLDVLPRNPTGKVLKRELSKL